MCSLIASEAHFRRTPDGCVYADGVEDYRFWAAYREVLGEVKVLARVQTVDAPQPEHSRSDGPGVEFAALEDYRGPWQYLNRLGTLRMQARRAVERSTVCLLRAPGAVAYLAWGEIRHLGKPYAVEVLGDPWDSLGPGRGAGSEYVWRPLARRWSCRNLRQLCQETPLACYVTREWLQRRYPPGAGAFSCSDARIDAVAPAAQIELRRERLRLAATGKRPWRLGFVGSLERLYKAPDIHLAAIAVCRRRGLDVRFTLAGEGRHRPALEQLAHRLGIGDIVCFRGSVLTGEAVGRFLDDVDLFLIASHCEGLPKALIEAMASGCPAIGSTAGGIPELLDATELVEPGRAELLAAKIVELLRDPARLAVLVRRNHTLAQAFTRERLDPVRRQFLEQVSRLRAP